MQVKIAENIKIRLGF